LGSHRRRGGEKEAKNSDTDFFKHWEEMMGLLDKDSDA
jgi:hypothetical protein